MARRTDDKYRQRTLYYQVDPRYFKDGDNRGSGDLNGLTNKLDYFKYLNVNSILLQNVLSTDTNAPVASFSTIATEIGNDKDLKKLCDKAKELNIKVSLEIKMGSVKDSIHWFREINKNKKMLNTDIDFDNDITIVEETSSIKVTNEKTISSLKTMDIFVFDDKTHEVGINWNSDIVQNKLIEVIQHWNDIGVSGFVVKDFEYACEPHKKEQMSPDTIQALRKLYKKIKAISRDIVWIAQSEIIDAILADTYCIRLELFDGVISHNVSHTGRNLFHKNDYLGVFSTRELIHRIKEFVQTEREILNFGTNSIGRIATRWGSDGQYWKESAKSIAILLLIHPSSKIIYMGDELGMTNLRFETLEDFNDPQLFETRKKLEQYEIDHDLFLEAQRLHHPINVQIAMPWTNEKNFGFSKVTPKVKIHHKAEELSVESQFKDKFSVLSFYRRLSTFTQTEFFEEIIHNSYFKIRSKVNGVAKMHFKAFDKNGSEVLAFVNLSKKIKNIRIPVGFEILFSTYNLRIYKKNPRYLDAYESIVMIKRVKENDGK